MGLWIIKIYIPQIAFNIYKYNNILTYINR